MEFTANELKLITSALGAHQDMCDERRALYAQLAEKTDYREHALAHLATWESLQCDATDLLKKIKGA
jgi:hypothetical protein